MNFEARFVECLGDYLPQAPRDWACAAARVFAAELQTRGASPHRVVVEALGLAWGLDGPRIETLGAVLDLVQVAIDVADNLADEQEDRALGRDVDARYASIPRPFLICLPSALINTAFVRLTADFAAPQYDLCRATRRFAWALAQMAEGQAANTLEEKIRLASGKQGLLLCLPAWLTPDEREHPVGLDALETWATAFGRSWEHQERMRTLANNAAKQAWNAARVELGQLWPKVPPFDDDGPLARERLLAPMMC